MDTDNLSAERWACGVCANVIHPTDTPCQHCVKVFTTYRKAVVEACRKEWFVWRDGVPYYLTANDMPMEIPRKVRKRIAQAVAGVGEEK